MSQKPTPAIAPPTITSVRDRLKRFPSPSTINVGVIERLASLLVGATVILIVVQRFFLYTTFFLAGGYLLYRGVTGYCSLYASEQIDTRHWRIAVPVVQRWYTQCAQGRMTTKGPELSCNTTYEKE